MSDFSILRRRKTLVGGLLLLCLLLFAIGYVRVYRNQTPAVLKTDQAAQATLIVGSTTLSVALAQTPQERQRGLSGRSGLATDTGMFFVFPKPDRYGFWMPDMHFAIDIIWIGEDWRIVDIAAHVSPESYPAIFNPKQPALYVLEVSEGTASAAGWNVGTTVRLREK